MQVERDTLQNRMQVLEAYAAAHVLDLHLYRNKGIVTGSIVLPQRQSYASSYNLPPRSAAAAGGGARTPVRSSYNCGS